MKMCGIKNYLSIIQVVLQLLVWTGRFLSLGMLPDSFEVK